LAAAAVVAAVPVVPLVGFLAGGPVAVAVHVPASTLTRHFLGLLSHTGLVLVAMLEQLRQAMGNPAVPVVTVGQHSWAPTRPEANIMH
jgi:hypothetical protein